MKKLVVLLLIFHSVIAFGQKTNDIFSIKIEEWNFMHQNVYTINDTMISIKKEDAVFSERYFLQGVGYPRFKEEIKEFLKKTDFTKSVKKFENASIDDQNEYNFTIEYEGVKIKRHIYMTEYSEYIKLVEIINEMIPSNCGHIGYDKDYLLKN